MRTRIKLAALAFATTIPTAYAGTTNANFQATASLNGACTVLVNNISFGAVTPSLTGEATATGEVKYKCTKGMTYTLSISKGSGTVSDRKMKGSLGDELAYNISTSDSNDPFDLWGNGTAGGDGVIYQMQGKGVEESLPIYGKLPLNQFVRPDTYSDTLAESMTY